jgi:hypothetical protein
MVSCKHCGEGIPEYLSSVLGVGRLPRKEKRQDYQQMKKDWYQDLLSSIERYKPMLG